MAFGHSLVAYSRTLRGLDKLQANEERIAADLQSHPEVLAEAIQTILRRENYPEPYEALKQLTRGRTLTLENIRQFVQELNISEEAKQHMLALTPETYTGLAAKLARMQP